MGRRSEIKTFLTSWMPGLKASREKLSRDNSKLSSPAGTSSYTNMAGQVGAAEKGAWMRGVTA